MKKKQKRMLLRILFTAAGLIVLWIVSVPEPWRLAAYLVLYGIMGYDILRRAAQGICNGRVLDENFLMAVASVGAFALAVCQRSGEYTEAVAVVLFYQIGELFEAVAVDKSRRSIAGLMDIRPDTANVEEDGQWKQVMAETVAVGTVIAVRPGERVPLDGIVTEGESSLNTSALTGESLPRSVAPGSEVFSGSVNLSGALRIRTTKCFGESTASKILELVENASSRKSRSEAFISRFARVYTPAVCAGALLLAGLPPVVRLLCGLDALWLQWLYRALTFLVISCPCALVISIPLTFFAGIGGASRRGILIKGSNDLEALGQVKTVVFDKTGTLTRGSFTVTGVHPSGLDGQRLLEYAALAESASSHPIAKSLVAACDTAPDTKRVSGVQEHSGRGVTAVVDGVTVAVGNPRLMEEVGAECRPCRESGAVVHVALDGRYAGCIVIADTLKPGAAEAIRSLERAGIEKTVMLTGDSQAAAEETARAVGIKVVCAELLPWDKVHKVEELIENKSGKVAFVGDGINDAPVLARADVGVAMGALGSDAAIEAADVVLMEDDPARLVTAIRISRRCMAIVRQNIVFALTVKGLCLLLGAAGAAGMWLAIFADVGVMVLAVLNAIRALRVSF